MKSVPLAMETYAWGLGVGPAKEAEKGAIVYCSVETTHACDYTHLKPQIDIPFIFAELSILITVHTLGVHMSLNSTQRK